MNINELGKKLVSCDLNCEGINNNPKEGVIPRCLITEERKGKNKAIIVGLNPGKAKNIERQYYLTHGISYNSVLDYFFQTNLHERAYFKRLRDLITLLKYDGDILWTDLAKCQLLPDVNNVPVQTLRICISRFLRKEIELFNASTIFALGNIAYDFCALSFPNHFVVGIPHPTGSYGNFIKLRNKIRRNLDFYIGEISNKKDTNGNNKAIHLSRLA